MGEKSLLDLIKETFDRRRMHRLALLLAALYLLGTGMAGMAAGFGRGPLIRLSLGTALLAAAWLMGTGAGRSEQARAPAPSAIDGQGTLDVLRSLGSRIAAQARQAGIPIAVLLAFSGSWCLRQPNAATAMGLFLLAAGVILLLAMARGREADLAPPAAGYIEGGTSGARIRRRFAAGAAGLSTLASFSLAGGHFTALSASLWMSSVAAWIAALWLLPPHFWTDRQRMILRFWREGIPFRLAPRLLLILGIVTVLAVFRFSRLDTVPPEMTSEHVEELLVVSRIVNEGELPVFEPGIGGREPMAFYLAAAMTRLAGTGLTHLTLKIVSASAGFVTLLFVCLLAFEIAGNRSAALLSMFAAGVAWWPNVLGRLGLRASLGPLFSAVALWLMVRAIRRSKRNCALLSGLAAGMGMSSYAPMWAVPVASALAPALYALRHRERSKVRQAVEYWAVGAVATLAVLVPLLRYHLDHRHDLWVRIRTLVWGDDGIASEPILRGLLRNAWDSVRMFHWTADGAWIVSPPGQPALDWIMAGLLVVGVAWLCHRWWQRQGWLEPFVLLSLPLLLLPSMLALSVGGRENPSLLRSSAAIPIVFVLVGAALSALTEPCRRSSPDRPVKVCGALLMVAALAVSASANWRIVFGDYDRNYTRAAQNASGIGRVVSAFAHSVGSYETVFVKSYPHWADTRAVGIYAGRFGWEQAICDTCVLRDARALKDERRPKLFIVHPADLSFLQQLQETYPDGSLRTHAAEEPHHGFLCYFVPGQLGATGRPALLR